MSDNQTHACSCPCGETQMTLEGEPLMRIICHCTICQEFNDAPYADICMASANKVQLANPQNVSYKAYAKPEIVQRGKCKNCGKPAIEYIEMPTGKLMAIIPCNNFKEQSVLPKPQMHGFYHSRQQDVNDGVPKHSGYIRSQAAFAAHVTKAIAKRLF